MVECVKLAEKLKVLYTYQFNPSVTSNVELGSRLGVSKQAVSRWCRGTPTQPGDTIPNNKLVPLTNVFGIDPFLLDLDLSAFEEIMEKKTKTQIALGDRSKDLISISMLPNTGLDVFGRDEELELLNDCWHSNTISVVQIVAFGGVGKSSLVNKWLSNLSQENYRYAERVYGWSFHWQSENAQNYASGDFFIENALQWFGDETPSKGTPWSKAIRLARLVRKQRTLLILDGVDVIQNPPGEGVGVICDPAIAILVKELATSNNGLCVLTTRLRIRELIGFEDIGCTTLELENLSIAAAVQMLESGGLKGEEKDFRFAAEFYSGHALSLSLLAGYLSVVHQGEISKCSQVTSLLEERGRTQQVRQLMSSYLNWYENTVELEILYIANMFDSAVQLDEIKEVIRSSSSMWITRSLADLNHAGWSYALETLQNSHLIQIDKQTEGFFIDCHPLVRDFVKDHLRNIYAHEYIRCKSALFEFYSSQLLNTNYKESDQELAFKAVLTGSESGRYEESFSIYSRRIKNGFIMLADGSHYMDQACLKSFFKVDWTTTVEQLDEEASHYLKSCVAANLITLGRISESIAPARESINYFISVGDWMNACQAAGPLISAMIETGNLRDALELLESLNEIVKNLDNAIITALSNNFEAYARFLTGDTAGARKKFREVENTVGTDSPDFEVLAPVISSYYGKFLIETGESDKAVKRMLKSMNWRTENSWQSKFDTVSIEASDKLVLGLAYLECGDYAKAGKYLYEQVELFRAGNEWLYLPTGLNSRARLLIELGKFDQAIQDLNESIEISKRTGARLGEWGAYMELARLSVKREEVSEAIQYLREADQLPGINDYKYCRRMIQKLAREFNSEEFD